MKMLKYFFLLQVLCFGQLFCWQNVPSVNLFGSKLEDDPVPIYFTKDIFQQRLDHFDRTPEGLKELWIQHYWQYSRFYKPGGPIFFIMGTNGGPGVGAWYKYAEHFGGMFFYLEHRYYGEGRPTPDASTENLKYLTSEQALADAALFISMANRRYDFPKDTKWIALGAGYSGSLATWLRSKYSHLVHGAVASSPLVEAQPNGYYDFFDDVENILNYHVEGCGSAVNDAFTELNELWKNESEHRSIERQLQLCRYPEPTGFEAKLFNAANLNAQVASFIGDAVANNLKYNSNFNGLCEIMTNKTLGTPLQRIGAYISKRTSECVPYIYGNMEVILKQTNWNDQGVAYGSRQMFYQTLREFGFFPVPKPLSPIQYHFSTVLEKLAKHVFGPEFAGSTLFPSRITTNLVYGGLDIDVTNVVFVKGSEDPWKRISAPTKVNPSSAVIAIEGGFHATDSYFEHEWDTPEVEAAREEIIKYIQAWQEE